jgi:hypothetical protein
MYPRVEHTLVINALIQKIKAEENREISYLELGIGDGVSFGKIGADKKVSVDMYHAATFKCKTTEFFAKNTEKFDVIFIDADHKADAVSVDLREARKICNKYIIVHDCNPSDQSLEASNRCGDGWKAWSQYVIKSGFDAICGDFDFGVGVWSVGYDVAPENFALVEQKYSALEADRVKMLNLVTRSELKERLKISY